MDRHRPALLEAKITGAILNAFRRVYGALGFGYRELIYSLAMERELTMMGHLVEREVPIIVYYRGEPLARQTFDMIVDRRVIVEIKATEQLHASASAQLFSYLCSTDIEVGLLLHFGRHADFNRVICENRLKQRNAPASGNRNGDDTRIN